MSDTCSQKQMIVFDVAHKENAIDMLVISVSPDGSITVQDHSNRDAGKELIRRLNEMGIETKTIVDSPCG